MRILVTGATGFVGRALLPALAAARRFELRAALRRDTGEGPTGAKGIVVGEIDGGTDWRSALDGVDVVIHLAAHAHVPSGSADAKAAFHRVNVEGTLNLARQAAVSAGRFIFVSTVKVHGEGGRTPYRESDVADPQDEYARSKQRAEAGLKTLTAETAMQLVVLRPPLIYGPGVGANFCALMRAVFRGIPLPLAAVNNRRSLIGTGNLADVIGRCVDDPRAGGQSFLLSDGEDLSTAELVRRLARQMGRPPRLFPVPPRALLSVARLVGAGGAARRLCGDLHVDAAKLRRTLDWAPRFTVDEELRRTVEHFLATRTCR